MDISKIEVNKKTVKKSVNRVAGNDDIAEYYKMFAEEKGSDTLFNRSEWVSQCYKFWDIDHYRKQSVKDIKRITLCKDKFCLNCQNNAALKREMKYQNILDDLRKRYDIYHIVFTVPNCAAEDLVSTLNRMYSKFPYVVQYLQGKRKCNNVNFVKFGFVGAVRGLEVTTKILPNGYEFHPHFHTLFIFRKGLDKQKKHKNDFSFSNGIETRKFSDNEIFFQKVWRLLYDGERLTENALNNLKQGYSVIMDDIRKRANGTYNYHQVFKYALKGTFKKGAPIFNYEEFKQLYKALYRRKMIQGYGVLNRFDFEDDVTPEEIDRAYQEIVAMLKSVELPQVQTMTLQDVVKEIDEKKNVTYISRNTVRRELRENGND